MILNAWSVNQKLSPNELLGNAREEALPEKPGVPIVCVNSSGNMVDRYRTNWLTVSQRNEAQMRQIYSFHAPRACRSPYDCRSGLRV